MQINYIINFKLPVNVFKQLNQSREPFMPFFKIREKKIESFD